MTYSASRFAFTANLAVLKARDCETFKVFNMLLCYTLNEGLISTLFLEQCLYINSPQLIFWLPLFPALVFYNA